MTIQINTDFGPMSIDYDPKAYKTRAGAAKGLHKALCKWCGETGYGKPFIRTPQENSDAGYEKCWHVSWEDGPYEWAIGASFQIEGPWGFAEPYYSFDLDFVY